MPRGIYERTENQLRNMSKAKTGKNNPFYGKHLSKGHKRKLSKAQSGKNNSMYGKIGEDSPRYGMTGEKHPMWKGGSRDYYHKLSRKIWEEYHNRKIPKGFLIHHKDENWKNINPGNLELMESNSGHIKHHWQIKKLILKESINGK